MLEIITVYMFTLFTEQTEYNRHISCFSFFRFGNFSNLSKMHYNFIYLFLNFLNIFIDYGIIIIIIMAVRPFVGPWPLLQFVNLFTIDRTQLDGQSARHKASTYTQNNTNTEYNQIFMPRVGFKPTITVF
jgi:hypothetical protein